MRRDELYNVSAESQSSSPSCDCLNASCCVILGVYASYKICTTGPKFCNKLQKEKNYVFRVIDRLHILIKVWMKCYAKKIQHVAPLQLGWWCVRPTQRGCALVTGVSLNPTCVPLLHAIPSLSLSCHFLTLFNCRINKAKNRQNQNKKRNQHGGPTLVLHNS